MIRFVRLAFASSLVAGLAAASACGGSVATDTAPPDAGTVKNAPPPAPPPVAPPDADVPTGPVSSSIVADEFGAEVQVAVSKSGRIVVAWIGLANGDAAIRYAITDDDGATFTPAKSVGRTVGDPVVGALDDGSFLLGGLRADCPTVDTCTNGELFLARLPAGAADVTAIPSLREPTNAFIDHPWMITHGADVSLIGAVFPMQDGGAYQYGMTVWRSPDRGGTFDRTEVVPATDANQIGIPRFCGGDGTRTWAHFYDGTAATYGRLRWTDALDDGWTTTNTASAGGVVAGGTLTTTGACAAHGDTLYAIIGQPVSSGGGNAMDATPTFGDLHIMATSDLGKTWTEQSVISLTGYQYLLPEINVEPDGTLDVFYYTGQTLDGPGRAELVRGHANGTKLDAPIVLKGDLSYVSDRGSPRWLGDYNAVNFAAGRPILAFGDNAGSRTRIRFAKLTQ